MEDKQLQNLQKVNAAVPLLPYQMKWVLDSSHFKIVNKGRQIGFSFAASLELVLDALAKKTRWVVLSTGERQSEEFMEKVKMHVAAIGYACEILETDFRMDEKTKVRQLDVILPNGSRIIGLPANPKTARGYTGNVVLDEFAFHEKPLEIWRALVPTITRGYRIIVISTPNGKSGKFYELYSANDKTWSRHFVDIYMAKEQGLVVNIEELQDAVGDSDSWSQEYEGVFLDGAGALLTYDLIAGVEDSKIGQELPENFNPNGDLYLGMDIGRKKDLTIIWLKEMVGDVLVTRAVEKIEKQPFRIQREKLYSYLDLPRLRRACIDSTGIGAQLAEEAAERYGKTRVEEVNFTAPVKSELALDLKKSFEDRRERIPSDRIIRADLYAVKKFVTSSGNIRFDADRTEHGHSDRFWACALATHAAKHKPSGPPNHQTVVARRFSGVKGRGY